MCWNVRFSFVFYINLKELLQNLQCTDNFCFLGFRLCLFFSYIQLPGPCSEFVKLTQNTPKTHKEKHQKNIKIFGDFLCKLSESHNHGLKPTCGMFFAKKKMHEFCLYFLHIPAPGCSWLLLAAPGCSWLLLLAASGCSWPSLVNKSQRAEWQVSWSQPDFHISWDTLDTKVLLIHESWHPRWRTMFIFLCLEWARPCPPPQSKKYSARIWCLGETLCNPVTLKTFLIKFYSMYWIKASEKHPIYCKNTRCDWIQ